MAGSTFGTLFRVTTAGESHGPGNVCIVDGCPPGLELSVDDLIPDLQRRKPGQSRIVSPRKEDDAPEILSGVFEGKTTGTPIAVLVRNKDQRSQDYGDIKDKYRPGHADFTFDAKFGFRDYRGGGRSSARETTVRVAAAAIAKKLLRTAHGIEVVGYVDQVGDLKLENIDPASVTLQQVEANPVRCPDPDMAAKMEQLITDVRKQQDSIGGASTIVATNVPAGWGEPVFDKLKADLGKAMFSLPAVMGVEYGEGFGVATARGTEHCDTFIPGGAKRPSGQGASHKGAKPQHLAPSSLRLSAPSVATSTNRHGGMLGGISSGLPIVLRCAVKPTSSIPQDRPTVDKHGNETTIATRGRHDPCLLPRFVPMGEAMMALVLADHMLRQRAIAGFDH
ncbi:MAG: chorismate synthase [Phycisphaeraceae bacterium]